MSNGYCNLIPEDFIRINVCGQNYTIMRNTLDRFPNTLLGNEERRQEHYVEFLDALYFDHNRDVFEAILYYYQSSGCLLRPPTIPMHIFERVSHRYII